jgi:hypothetical protein
VLKIDWGAEFNIESVQISEKDRKLPNFDEGSQGSQGDFGICG